MSRADYDVAILGAGLAGLSLAARLAAPCHAGLRILLVEPRTTYRRDRTWSYWSVQPHPFEDAVAHRWERWAVADGRREFVCGAAGLHYATIQSDAFYRVALERVRAASHIELRLGTMADAVEDGDGVRVRLQSGVVRAALAFDTRPPRTIGRHGLSQAFLGQEITTEEPVFDPGVATIMDFRCGQGGRHGGAAHFTYVLPTSPRHALVEDTWFAPACRPLPDHRAAIRAYMAERHGVHRYTVGFEERGALPMDPVFQPRAGARLLPLGTAGGATRPSTGYAFNAIQARCDSIVADLAAGRQPRPARPRPGVVRYMDRVLLQLLETKPDLAAGLFTGLFEGCAPGALVRFLNDRASLADLFAVTAAMPLLPVAGAAARLAMGEMEWLHPETAG